MIIESFQFRSDELKGPDFSVSHFKELTDNQRDVLKFTRSIVCGLLGVPDLDRARQLVTDMNETSQEWHALNQTICSFMCNQYSSGIAGDQARVLVSQSMETANRAISKFTDPNLGLLRADASVIGEMSGAYEQNDPLKLLKMSLDVDHYSREIRFEASRKLELSNNALEIHIREAEGHTKKDVKWLIDFFNTKIWNGDKIGTTEIFEFISTHNPTDFQCTDIEILGPGEKTFVDPYHIYHKYRMRRTKNGIRAMFEHREKDDGDILLKMIRKSSGYDSLTDKIGIRLVFEKKQDIGPFLEFLAQSAIDSGFGIKMYDSQNTIDNDQSFTGNHDGSSKKLEEVKMQIVLNGIEFELQMLTPRTYVDYHNLDGVSHSEYAIRRQLMQIGSMLFPHAIYGILLENRVRDTISAIREGKLRQTNDLPPDRSQRKGRDVEYGSRMFESDYGRVLQQLTASGWQPEIIIGDAQSALFSARLAREFGCTCVLTNFDDPKSIDPAITAQVLLATNISHTGQTLARLVERLPNAKIAVLINQSDQPLDFVGREEPGTEVWYRFNT